MVRIEAVVKGVPHALTVDTSTSCLLSSEINQSAVGKQKLFVGLSKMKTYPLQAILVRLKGRAFGLSKNRKS